MLIAAWFVAVLLCVDAMGQQPRSYPPYTLVIRLTKYDQNGETIRVTTHTRYQSSSGDWRVVTKSGGGEQATIYRRGRGVYNSDSRTSRIIKIMDHAPGCPLSTAEQLRRDPKFVRTEGVLGFTAYVLIESPTKDLLIEHYYVPEVGGALIKQVTMYKSGPKFVTEPISLTPGEPAAIDVTGPDYLVIDQVPVFLKNLADHLLSKLDADYPAEALVHGWSGVVQVMVTVDDTGAVITAGALDTGLPPQSLRDAALEAAYKASFNPIIAEGRIVVAQGILPYRFVLPK